MGDVDDAPPSALPRRRILTFPRRSGGIPAASRRSRGIHDSNKAGDAGRVHGAGAVPEGAAGADRGGQEAEGARPAHPAFGAFGLARPLWPASSHGDEGRLVETVGAALRSPDDMAAHLVRLRPNDVLFSTRSMPYPPRGGGALLRDGGRHRDDRGEGLRRDDEASGREVEGEGMKTVRLPPFTSSGPRPSSALCRPRSGHGSPDPCPGAVQPGGTQGDRPAGSGQQRYGPRR